MESLESLGAEIRSFTEKVSSTIAEQSSRLLALEQKATSPRYGSDYNEQSQTIGEKLIGSENFKAFTSAGLPRSGKIRIGDLHKTALVNSTLGSSTLVQADRRGILPPIQRRLTVRDVLPQAQTSSNAIEYPKESSFTNNAAPQYSAGAYENVTKAESAISFTLNLVPVTTVAHWLPVSRQLLDDAPGLSAYVNSRLLYGLKKKEEEELLNGSGIQGHLSGLITNATAFETNYSDTSGTYLDALRKGALQLLAADLNPDVCIVNPVDWDTAISTKESGSGISSGQYIFADPAFMPRNEVWGMRVVVTNSMTQSQFLIMDSNQAGMIFDRQDATVEVSREHSDYFVRNMAAVLVEERLALAVFNSTAVIYGGFPFGS
jgi:HK97 family phage major capsid protein